MLYRQIILEWGQDTESGVWGLGYSPDNGKNFYVLNTTHGRKYRAEDGNRLYPYISDQVQDKIETVVAPAKSAANSAVAYANDAIEKSRVNSQAIVDINSAVSDAVSGAAVARSDGLRAWNAAQSNVGLIDWNYASASAAISSARTEAIAAADEAKSSASAAQAGVVAVRSDVAVVQADVTATQSEVAVAKSDIADTKTSLTSQAKSLSSYVAQANAAYNDTANALSDAKMALTSDVAAAKNLANTAQATADSAVKSVSSVADDLTTVASQAKANANGITKVTSDVGTLQTTVADNSGNISKIQETAKQIQQAVSDNAGKITVAKQTADSAVTVASDARSNATVAIQTASQASITANNASGQAASAVITANGALTTASNAESDATVAVQTASGASLTATNAQSDATIAKQTASEATVQASNAESDFAQLSIRANKIEANVATNSGAIASVQQTASGLTTTVANIKSNGGGVNLASGTTSDDQTFGNASQTTGWRTPTIATFDNPQAGQQYTISVNAKTNGGTWIIEIWDGTSPTQGGKYLRSFPFIQGQKQMATFTWPSGSNKYLIVQLANHNDGGQITWNSAMLEEGTVAHTWSPAPNDLKNQFTQIKASIDGVTTIINDPKTGMTATYQTASQASLTAQNASGQAVTAVTTAQGAVTTAKNAQSDATVAIQTASGASLTATNVQGDASIAKQTASEAKVQASNAESDFAQLSVRANKIETNVANNSGAIASVQQTANGLTTTVGNVDNRVKTIEDKTNWTTKTGPLDMNTLTTTQNIYYRDTNLKNADGEAGWAYIQVVSTGERVTQTVWHDRSSIQHTRTGAIDGSTYDWDAWNEVATNAQVVEVKKTVDGIATTINDPKTGLNATYQAAAGNATTISNVKSDVYKLEMTASGLTSRVGNLESKTNTQETATEQNKNAIKLKADQADVDKINGTVSRLQSSLTVQAEQIKEKVTSSQVTGMLTGYATQEYAQGLVTLKADEWNVNLTKLKNDTQTSLSSLAIGVEGVQTQVYNSDGSSKITQLSNLIATKVSQGDYNSQITQLHNDINLRVAKGDVISQINQEAGGDMLIQVSNGKKSLILDAGNTIFTGKAWIPSAAISNIQVDQIQIGDSRLFSDDGTFNLVNQNNGLKALIQVKQGLVQNTMQSIISFSSDYNNRAFSVTPVGATITPTLFFERYDQTEGHWLGFTRNEVRRDGLMFHTWDDEGERFFVGCHARFDRNISVDGTINQGTWNGTSGKPEAGILTIKSGNTIWSGSDFLAIGDHISNSFTNVMARSFSQQSTLSSKTNIETVDPKYALDLVNRTDILSYQYKADVAQGKTKRYTSMILDDVNDVSKYYAPDEFANEERTGRDDGSAVGYLFLAVQELTRRIKNLEEKLHE